MRRPRWQSAKRPDTAIGAFVMGFRAYSRGKYKEVPERLSRKDTRGWILGWNEAARKNGNATRLVVPEITGRKARKMKTPPNDTEAAVLREAVLMARSQGWYVERRNTGAIRTDSSFLRFGSPGAADLIVVIRVRDFPVHIEAEAKRRDGKGRLSDSQREFCGRMEKFGIPYIVFASGEEFRDQILQISLDLTNRL